MSATEEWTTVPAREGDLRACVWAPEDPHSPRPGLVLVDGSGDGACDDWGEWPHRFVDCGSVVLAHDKPGCGESPGDWTTQSFADRAHESLAALEVLRRHPAVEGQPVGLLGFSQGGWVSFLAAAAEPRLVDFVVSVSGPGVGTAEQERYRIERNLFARGTSDEHLRDALAWIDERTERLVAGEDVLTVLADQARLADRPWYEGATQYFDNPLALAFLARNLDFDPVPVLEQVRCPVLALLGGGDTLVPALSSAASYATHLRGGLGGDHGIAVFPGADHGLFIADPDPGIARTDQLAAGFLPMLTGFLARQSGARFRNEPALA
jgi:pimeloyl-ACP methyl ester carboxylesterase